MEHHHQERVGQVNSPVVVHVAQNTAGQRLAPRQFLHRFNHELHRSHPRPHRKGRIHVGHHTLARNDDTIGLLGRFGGRIDRRFECRAARHRNRCRCPGLPVNEYQPPRQLHAFAAQPVDIHAGRHSLPSRIRRIPPRRVKTGRSLFVHQRRHALTQHVKNLQPHVRRRGELIRNNRRRIERIGIILPQRKPLRHHGATQRRQRQRKKPIRISGHLRHRAALQRRQIEYHYLRGGHRFTGRKAHSPLYQRLGNQRGRQHQPDKRDDGCFLHR